MKSLWRRFLAWLDFHEWDEYEVGIWTRRQCRICGCVEQWSVPSGGSDTGSWFRIS